MSYTNLEYERRSFSENQFLYGMEAKINKNNS